MDTDWRAIPDDVDALYVYSAEVALEQAEAWQERYDHLRKDARSVPSMDDEDLCDARAYFAVPRECWPVPIAPDERH